MLQQLFGVTKSEDSLNTTGIREREVEGSDMDMAGIEESSTNDDVQLSTNDVQLSMDDVQPSFVDVNAEIYPQAGMSFTSLDKHFWKCPRRWVNRANEQLREN